MGEIGLTAECTKEVKKGLGFSIFYGGCKQSNLSTVIYNHDKGKRKELKVEC